jgi:hypothetical protein
VSLRFALSPSAAADCSVSTIDLRSRSNRCVMSTLGDRTVPNSVIVWADSVLRRKVTARLMPKIPAAIVGIAQDLLPKRNCNRHGDLTRGQNTTLTLTSTKLLSM